MKLWNSLFSIIENGKPKSTIKATSCDMIFPAAGPSNGSCSTIFSSEVSEVWNDVPSL